MVGVAATAPEDVDDDVDDDVEEEADLVDVVLVLDVDECVPSSSAPLELVAVTALVAVEVEVAVRATAR